MDFRNFFPSIKGSDLSAYLDRTRSELSPEDQSLLIRTLFWRSKRRGDLVLSIGAPSSPTVSNALMWEFDGRVASQCRALGVEYTRYSDDLTFSTNKGHTLLRVENAVKDACKAIQSPAVIDE